MAVHASQVGDGVNQSTLGWFDIGLDWTRMGWIRYDAASTGSDYYTNQYLWDTDGIASYAYLEPSLPGTPFVVDVEIFVGATFASAQFAASAATWFHFAMRYSSVSHEIAVFLDGVRAVGYGPDIVQDFSGVFTQYGGALTDGFSLAGNATGYDRLWQAALSDAEILAEKNSPIAVRSADILWDTPLPAPSNLLDLSGNGHNWSLIGSLGYIQGPFAQAVLLTQLPLEVAYDMGAWRPYVGGGANGWETPAPPTSHGDIGGLL